MDADPLFMKRGSFCLTAYYSNDNIKLLFYSKMRVGVDDRINVVILNVLLQ